MARTVVCAQWRSAITTRSSSERNLGEITRLRVLITPGYCTARPVRLVIDRPYRQRVPVRRLIPTLRQASELLTPCAISRANALRSAVLGDGPGVRSFERR